MKKFLVLYHSAMPAKEMMSKTTPEQGKAGMDLWKTWMKSHEKNHVEWGSPLDQGKEIKPGSMSDSDSTITGFGIMQAESMQALADALKDHPHFHTPGDVFIEVLEYLPMPGMEM